MANRIAIYHKYALLFMITNYEFNKYQVSDKNIRTDPGLGQDVCPNPP